jgi:hypothetical protein
MTSEVDTSTGRPLRKTYPGISLSNWPTRRLISSPYKNPNDRENLAAALRVVGMPE